MAISLSSAGIGKRMVVMLRRILTIVHEGGRVYGKGRSSIQCERICAGICAGMDGGCSGPRGVAMNAWLTFIADFIRDFHDYPPYKLTPLVHVPLYYINPV
jgi:hypothetical protein